VRFKGGITQTLRLPNAPRAWDIRRHHPDVVAEIDRLLDDHNYKEILGILNEKKMQSGVGMPFTPTSLSQLCRRYKLKTRFQRLRDRGQLTPQEVAAQLGICVDTVAEWRNAGLLRGHAYNDCNACLYEKPHPTLPRKRSGQSLTLRSRLAQLPAACGQEV
jgi:DNA-binding transcriptional regulator YiaG